MENFLNEYIQYGWNVSYLECSASLWNKSYYKKYSSMGDECVCIKYCNLMTNMFFFSVVHYCDVNS